MNGVGNPERVTQNRVVSLFRDELGYRHLGNWTDRPGNSNIEEELLSGHLGQHGNAQGQIAKAVHELRSESNNANRSLYENNKQVYGLLRYGVPVKVEAGAVTETVKLIDWDHPG